MYFLPESEEITTADVTGEHAPIRMAELLGSGRHGVVLRARQTTPAGGIDIAVKIPSGDGSLDDEAHALRRFAHPHVVSLLDGPLPNGSLILELCDRGSLADTRLPPSEVVEIVRSITAALRPIHALGWIHGDINPSNIGLRSGDGAALLDFVTARPADGSFLDEGTAEFAGPFRQAVPQLDVRCLAATALAALDSEADGASALASHFEHLVAQCDDGEPAGLDDLSPPTHMVTGSEPAEPSDAPSEALAATGDADAGSTLAKAGGGDPPTTSRTRPFGPRPADSPDDDDEAPTPSGPPVHAGWLVALAIGIAVLGASFLTELTGQSPQSTNGPLSVPAGIERLATPTETLDEADATWDSSIGVLVRRSVDESSRLAVGEPGDIAAVGDWNCDGSATLAVFRPSNRNWFVFASWRTDAKSTVDVLTTQRGLPSELRAAVGDVDLAIRIDANGCATPVLLG